MIKTSVITIGFPKIPSSPISHTIFSLFLPLDKSIANSNGTISDFSSRYLDFIEANLDRDWAVKRLGKIE